MSARRYKAVVRQDGEHIWVGLVDDPDGNLVEHEDYAELAANMDQRLKAEAKRVGDAIEQLRSRFADTEWQPIETAPKDGTDILCFCVEPEFKGEENPYTCYKVCFFGLMQEDYSCWMSNYGYEQRPTHWMPLPKPPAA